MQPSSLCASSVVLVPKKDGSLNFYVDFRRLNSVTMKDVYPLPRVDDNAQYFTILLDLASRYWQVPLDKNVRPKNCFYYPQRTL